MADVYFHRLDFKLQGCLKMRREMTRILVLCYSNGPVDDAAGLKTVCFQWTVAFSKSEPQRGGSGTAIQILR